MQGTVPSKVAGLRVDGCQVPMALGTHDDTHFSRPTQTRHCVGLGVRAPFQQEPAAHLLHEGILCT